MDETPQSQTPSLSNLPVDWRDRGKADAFVEEGFRLQDEAEREMEAEFQRQWQEEHGWKYGPSGDKFWEEEDYLPRPPA